MREVQVQEGSRTGAHLGPVQVFAAFLRAVEMVVNAITGVLLAVMVLVTTLAIVGRNVGIPLDWAEELARILLIWMVFMGAAAAVRKGEHLSLQLIQSLVPPRILGFIEAIVSVGSIALLAFLISPGIDIIQRARTSTTMLSIPWAYLYAAFAVSLGFALLFHLGGLVERLATLRKPAPEPSGRPGTER